MAVLMAGLTAVAAAETVYKWVDGQGQIHYSDLPPTRSDARILGIVHSAGVIEDEESGNDDDDYDDAGDNGAATAPDGMTTTPEPPVSREAMQAALNDAEKAKVEQCKIAQDRYQRYIESRRLFREVDGKRVYLSDQELTEARARARQAVDDYCR
ncbi:MAG TPA: DUF4124 domain-containing protein [Steroidobacteraceae bacterium]|nr:DUF4124 domain-containing protein [Steroidobacteraceae bacterium]